MTRDASTDQPATFPASTWQPVPLTQVRIDDAFWSPRIAMNRLHTLPHAYDLLEETGRLAAFRLDWVPGQQPEPHIFWDSDVGKWLEAACYSLATHPDPHLAGQVAAVVALVAGAQQPDGYLNTHFTAVAPEQRWTNLRDWHELYNAGHLIEAAVAHYQTTGTRTLLDVMCRYADYIEQVFGDGPGQIHGYDGHEEIELALVKLAQVTGEERYVRLAAYFVEARGHQPHFFDMEAQGRGTDPAAFEHGTYEYNQSHLPVREQNQVVGHAVRAMYLYAAMADLARELGDATLLVACRRLWDHLNTTRLYVTGGLGTARYNEGFTADYDLPNETAYAETCAAIGLVFWAQRMLHLDCDRRYGDAMERALYNGVLSGVSQDGTHFFYENPLASSGHHHRQEWYAVSCCPTNIARLLPSLGQYIYAHTSDEIAVHLYIQSTAQVAVAGQTVTLRQETQYPWEGHIALHINVKTPTTFGLRLRLPGWCRDPQVHINGERVVLSDVTRSGYARLTRTWHAGDVLTLDLAMPIERVYAHPRIQADVQRVALQRGPLIYCLEETDQGMPPQQILLPAQAALTSNFAAMLLDGVVCLHGTGLALNDSGWEEQIYRMTPPHMQPINITAVPYYAWDNRQRGAMSVWLYQME